MSFVIILPGAEGQQMCADVAVASLTLKQCVKTKPQNPEKQN